MRRERGEKVSCKSLYTYTCVIYFIINLWIDWDHDKASSHQV